jgi:hypothetical protein
MARKDDRRLSFRRLLAYVGASIGLLGVVVAALIFVFGNSLLNHLGKGKAERSFAKAHPGSVLRIGKMDYSLGTNRLVTQSITLSSANTTLKVGPISLTGARWTRLLFGKAALADVLAKAVLEARDLDVEFTRERHGIRCARLRASIPVGELIAEGIEMRSLVGDEAFFAAYGFRRTRFHVIVPECRVSGLEYDELLRGKSYQAGSIQLSRPAMDALVNRDKPPNTHEKSPLMVHEALASIRPPLRVGSLIISGGSLRYCERPAVGAAPAVLTFGAVSISVEGIANRGDATAAVQLRAQGDLMNAGTLKVWMSIPITSPNFSLRYSGSLGAMDLTRLNPFLEIADHLRIKSGRAQDVAFEIVVTAGQALGRVQAVYKDLVLAALDKQNGTENGFGNRVASFLMNAFKIRNSNARNASGMRKEGKIDYTRSSEETFLQFAWFALRTGVVDVISH